MWYLYLSWRWKVDRFYYTYLKRLSVFLGQSILLLLFLLGNTICEIFSTFNVTKIFLIPNDTIANLWIWNEFISILVRNCLVCIERPNYERSNFEGWNFAECLNDLKGRNIEGPIEISALVLWVLWIIPPFARSVFHNSAFRLGREIFGAVSTQRMQSEFNNCWQNELFALVLLIPQVNEHLSMDIS